MGLFYVEKGTDMPTGVSDLQIGDIVKVRGGSNGPYSLEYRIIGFTDDGDSTDTLLTAVEGDYVCKNDNYAGFTLSSITTLGGWDYNVFASEDVSGYKGTSKRLMYWESEDLELVEKYVSDFWKL
ncbi:MAG: hypothetical protein ACRCX2_20395 [Paraclostridium sp.]